MPQALRLTDSPGFMMQKKIAMAVVALALASPQACNAQEGLARIKTIVVIYAENRSFDHLYGFFPGADGITNASSEQKTQLDHDGTVLPYLTIFGPHGKPDGRFPRMPNEPYRIDAAPINVPLNQLAPNPIHAFYHNQEQVNGGRNNMFAAMSNVGGWTMGYFDGSQLRLWEWAKQYTLADKFFMGAFGGSFLNHFWLVCACTPRFPEAPESMRVQLDSAGKLIKAPDSPSAKDGAVETLSDATGFVSPDGYAVNTTQPPYQPSGFPPKAHGSLDFADPSGTPARGAPLPPQSEKTIGDTLSARDVTWTWYAGGWSAALADGRRPPSEKRKVIYTREGNAPYFAPHHQPLNYFARFAPGTDDRSNHLRDGEDFVRDIEHGSLPQVTFYSCWAACAKARNGRTWLSLLHMTRTAGSGITCRLPQGAAGGDRWGPGTRIPTIIISPYAKRGYIDSTSYDTTSILKFITRRFGLEPLSGVRRNVGDLTAAFDFAHERSGE
jgi:acid phosphatase